MLLSPTRAVRARLREVLDVVRTCLPDVTLTALPLEGCYGVDVVGGKAFAATKLGKDTHVMNG